MNNKNGYRHLMVNDQKAKHDYGDVVYLRTDIDQLPRLITGVLMRPNYVQYELSQETVASWHQEIEISTERDVVMATGGTEVNN